MTDTYPTSEMKSLFQAIRTLKTPSELAAFFRDLLTIQELEAASTRWQIVRLLQKQLPYLEIARLCHVSTTTVTRVALWLEHGRGGYKTALSRLKK